MSIYLRVEFDPSDRIGVAVQHSINLCRHLQSTAAVRFEWNGERIDVYADSDREKVVRDYEARIERRRCPQCAALDCRKEGDHA